MYIVITVAIFYPFLYRFAVKCFVYKNVHVLICLIFTGPPATTASTYGTAGDSVGAVAAAADMAAMMASYGNSANLNPMMMPFMPLPGVLGTSQPTLPMQHVMKDFYQQSIKKYMRKLVSLKFEIAQVLNYEPSTK